MHGLSLRARCILHPATALVLWLFFVIWLEFAQPHWLGITAIVLLPWLRGAAFTLLVSYLRRIRWLLLSLLLIYAYTVPGESLLPALNGFSPSLPGLQHAGLRSARILLLLATLVLLMTHVSRAHLLLGVYRLLRPLRWLHIDDERIAVRLWLTLHYAETAIGNAQEIPIKQRLEELRSTDVLPASAISQIELADPGAGWIDYLCLLLALAFAVAFFG